MAADNDDDYDDVGFSVVQLLLKNTYSVGGKVKRKMRIFEL